MSLKAAILKPGKEKPIRNKHHWIFSGAIASLPPFENGKCLEVYSASMDFLGSAYFNRQAAICGRMISFTKESPEVSICKHLEEALHLRTSIFKNSHTDAYRLVNGEGDLLPGLVIDRYGDICVIQISTLGMKLFLPLIVDWLKKRLSCVSIYEKSLLPSRKEEGLLDEQGALFGEIPANERQILENGLCFNVSILHGQKTGFFLDHREMREYIRSISTGKRILNCFCYTGGFSVYAAAGKASLVDSVDSSSAAIEMAKKNMEINQFAQPQHAFYQADVFTFLRENPLNYDIVILDPPAFAKRKKDVVAACRGYKDINRLAMEKMPKDSILLTSSCSYHVNETLFQTVVFQAAVEAKRNVKIIGRHLLAPDHPINLCHPESDYLKSLMLYIT